MSNKSKRKEIDGEKRKKEGSEVAMASSLAKVFELNSGNNIMVKITNFGATITSLLVPDAQGTMADVVLGFDTLDSYLNGESPYFGCIVGRVANRIKEGNFSLDGIHYSLPINDPPNHLHGGHKGFDKVLWEVIERSSGENPSITFKYTSEDGDEGYPGDVTVTARYSLPTNTSLRLDMEAVPKSKATPVNLVQHTYWNLSGHGSGDVLKHLLQISSSEITLVDDIKIPTGEIMAVEGTPFDFSNQEKIGGRIEEVSGGYDHNYVLSGGEERMGLKHAAKVKDPSSLRVLNIWTDAPGMQFYTANYVNGVVGKDGALYGKHSALCLETQGFPNAINQPNFPSIVIKPGKKYRHTMVFEFSVDSS